MYMGANGLKSITTRTVVESDVAAVGWKPSPVCKWYYTFDKSIYDRLSVSNTTLVRRITFDPGVYVRLRVKIETTREPYTTGKTRSSLIIEDTKWPYNRHYTVPLVDAQAMRNALNILGRNVTFTTEWINDHYYYGPAEVHFTHVPGLPPAIKVQAVHSGEIESVERALGLRSETSMCLDEQYERYYGIPKSITMRRIVFASAARDVGDHIVRSHAGFDAILARQLVVLRELGLAEE